MWDTMFPHTKLKIKLNLTSEIHMHFWIPLGERMLLAINCEHEAGNDIIYMLLNFSSLYFVINKVSFSKYDKFMFNCALLQTVNRKCLVIKLYKLS